MGEYISDGVRYRSDRTGSPRNRCDCVVNLDVDDDILRRYGLEVEDVPVVEVSQWEASGEDVTALIGDVTKHRTVAVFQYPPCGRVWLFEGEFWRAVYSGS